MPFDIDRLLCPGAWVQLNPTSLDWDEALNAALDKHTPTFNSRYTTKVGPYMLWTGNFPYSYGHPYDNGPEVLPLLRTRRRLRKAILQAYIDGQGADK